MSDSSFRAASRGPEGIPLRHTSSRSMGRYLHIHEELLSRRFGFQRGVTVASRSQLGMPA